MPLERARPRTADDLRLYLDLMAIGRVKTWHLEYLFVGSVLSVVSYTTGNELKDWLCAVAVLLEFGEATIVDRLIEERDSEEIRRHTNSLRKLLPYTFIRETLWVIYFVLVHSYSALVGCFVFLLYPFWRKFWRRIHPHKPSSPG